MNRLTRWLDGVVERLCNWLNDAVSGRRRLALLGDGLAGGPSGTPLPVDRRVGPIVHEMHMNGGEMGNAAHTKSGSSSVESSCGFWAYCYMHGQPCVWCDGKNGLSPGNPYKDFSRAGSDLCPKGYHAGTAWYGCCKDPTGTGKLVAFMDCCTSSTLIFPFNTCKFKMPCSNWPEAKNWCVTGKVLGVLSGVAGMPPSAEVNVMETEHYYCTAVIDMQSDGQCN